MDPISDMLIQIKNAGNAKLPSVLVPYSGVKLNIANLLKKEGFIGDVVVRGQKIKKSIQISISYRGADPRISGVKRISKPSKRVYAGVGDIKKVRNGFGTTVLSTPKGILTGKDARAEHTGGELMFMIW